MQDPKQSLINILTWNLYVTKDDDTTKANVLVTSQWYSDQAMANFDALVTVGMLADPVVPSGFGFSKEDHSYMADVNVWCINKYNSTGARIITDEIMRYKIVQAVDSIIAANRTALTGIKRAKISAYRDLDDPQVTPYPMRRANIEIELWIPTITSLAA
jgi:hypothetical protein